MKYVSMSSFAVKITCTMALLSSVVMANTVVKEDDFEAGSGDWTLAAGDGAVGVVGDVGSKVLQLTVTGDVHPTATLDMPVTGGNTIYFRIRTKINPTADEDIADTEARRGTSPAAFYVKSDGTIMAYSGAANEWVVAGTIGEAVDVTAWYEFMVHLDYGIDKWSIYLGATDGDLTVQRSWSFDDESVHGVL